MKTKFLFAMLMLALSYNAKASLITGLGEFDPVTNAYNTNNVGSGWSRGWVFDALASDMWVVKLGLHTPSSNAGNFFLNLWDVNTKTLLASTAAVDTSTNWQWFDITATELQQGSRYLVSLFSQTANLYYYGNQLPVTSSDVKYITMQYSNNSTSTTFPTATLDNYQYGLVDFAYQIGQPSANNPNPNSVPEPQPFALFLLGASMLWLKRYLKR